MINLPCDDHTSSVCDTLVVQGEPIKVLCDLNFVGSTGLDCLEADFDPQRYNP